VAMRRLLLLLLPIATVLFVPVSPATSAPLPAAWCGSDESVIDRPDFVAGKQVHVIYAFPRDFPDRYFEFAREIARDLAGMDTWWRSQDPTRTPRVDLAAFPGCDSEFGAVDVSSLRLAADSATIDPDNAGFGGRIADALRGAGFVSDSKKYLLYYDGPGPSDACGVSFGTASGGGPFNTSIVFARPRARCDTDFGAGNGFSALVATHELVHGLVGRFEPGTAPNACSDEAHVCDAPADILATNRTTATKSLSTAVLDVGHDDYYAHGGSWWDARNSEWLVHLESPPGVVSVAVDANGSTSQVLMKNVDDVCVERCSLRYDGGTSVLIDALPQTGYQLIRWDGACSGSASRCTVTAGGNDVTVTAIFGPAVKLRARVLGPGSIAQLDGSACSDSCVWDVAPGAQTVVVADPDMAARFVGWRGLCRGGRRACSVAATLNTRAPHVVAVFRHAKPRPHRNAS
jgi:Fe-S cluster biogenesis protein NfuA